MALKPPPGPAEGITLPEARELQNDTLQFILKANRTWGDIVRYRIGFWDAYLLSHPDHVQHVLLDNWRNYNRDTFQFRNFSWVTGAGLLTLDGERWQAHRRLAQPGFHLRKLRGMGAGMLAAVERLAGRWNADLKDGGELTVDLDRELLRLALEIVGEALFSLDLGSRSARLSQELLGLMEYVIYRSQNLVAPPLWVPTPRNLGFRRRLTALDRLVYDLIDERRRSGREIDDFLGLLLGVSGGNGAPLSVQEVRDEVVTMIIAGYETVASGMGWILKLLAEHEEIQTRLREGLGALGEEALLSPDLGERVPLLSQVIDEAFRLYPPSWLITRRAQTADQIGGYDIPAGALILFSPYVVHRQEPFWPDPERFDPERFRPESQDRRHKFAYIPFGGGPHLCIGRPFALMEASLTLAGLLPHFSFSLASGVKPRPSPRVTIRPEPGLLLTVRPVFGSAAVGIHFDSCQPFA